MTGGMDKYWIIPRVGDKELPRIGYQLASCSILNSYVMFYSIQEVDSTAGTIRKSYC